MASSIATRYALLLPKTDANELFFSIERPPPFPLYVLTLRTLLLLSCVSFKTARQKGGKRRRRRRSNTPHIDSTPHANPPPKTIGEQFTYLCTKCLSCIYLYWTFCSLKREHLSNQYFCVHLWVSFLPSVSYSLVPSFSLSPVFGGKREKGMKSWFLPF